jgi:hypothetical protein
MQNKLTNYCCQLMAVLFATFIIGCGGGGNKPATDLIPVKNGDSWGYADRKGKIVINPQFKYASLFRDGMAIVAVRNDDKTQYGFINKEGKYLINPTFINATDFNDGVAMVVAENEAPKGINTKGEELFVLQNAESVFNFSEGLAAFSVRDQDDKVKWGFVNTKGEIKIQPQYNSVGNFSDGMAVFTAEGGKYGYIDKEGKIVINPQFGYASDFYEGKAIVQNGNQAGIIDTKGQYVLNPQFKAIIPDGSRYAVNSGGKWGWSDKEGKLVINPQFEEIRLFNGNSLAPVSSGRSWGYVDDEGKFVINPQFDMAFSFDGDMAAVKSGGQYGFIDKKGKFIINPQFDNISDDYLNYTIRNQQKREYVSSDYLDINGIVQRIQKEITPNTVAGGTFETTVGTLMSKYKKSENDFSYYYGNNSLFSSEKIGKYAELSLSIGGTIYISRGWSSYTINPDARPDEFIYELSLGGKAANKSEEIANAIAKGLAGFKPADESDSTAGNHLLTSDQLKVSIVSSGYKIRITVNPVATKTAE